METSRDAFIGAYKRRKRSVDRKEEAVEMREREFSGMGTGGELQRRGSSAQVSAVYTTDS